MRTKNGQTVVQEHSSEGGGKHRTLTPLRQLLEILAAPDIAVWAAPPGTEAQLENVVLYDAALGVEAGPGDLMLAVGVDAADAAAIRLVEEAGRRAVPAVVMRQPCRPHELLAESARQAGVTLLMLVPTLSWATATSRLRGALAASGSGPETDVPALPRHDLVAFANALAATLGGSVTIFNPQQEVLASSRIGPADDSLRQHAVLDQHGPKWYREALRARGVYRQLWAARDFVDIEGMPEWGAGRRLAIAVCAGDEILASIWVAEGEHPLPPEAGEKLRQAVHPVALHVLQQRTQAEARHRFEQDLGRRLLTGEGDAEVTARWLALDPQRPCAVITCRTAAAHTRAGRRIEDLLSMHVSAYRWATVLVPSRGGVDMIVGNLPACADSAVMRLARAAVTSAAEHVDQPLLGAVGRVVSGLDQLSRSRAEADIVLRVLRDGIDGTTRVATVDDVRAAANVLALTDVMAARPELRKGPVHTLIDHDQCHRTGYAASLAAYLDAFGNVADAAKRMQVHPNTLRYRLHRLVEISGLDLDDPDERLVAMLQLRAEQ